MTSPIKNVEELRGKKLAVSSSGSLSDWLGRRINNIENWPEGTVVTVAMGGLEPRLAAMKTGQIDGMVMAAEVVYALEDKKVVRPLFNYGKAIPNFITAAVFAHVDLIAKNPDLVQRFVNGLFATREWMQEHRDETIAFMTKLLKSTPGVMARTYDEQMPSFSTTGVFDPKAVEFMAQSFVEMGLLKQKPSFDKMATNRFVPAKY